MYRTANNPTDMWEGREVTAYLWNDESPDYDPGTGAVLLGQTSMIVPVGRGSMIMNFDEGPQEVSGH